MANQEHLDILKQGVEAWNEWREKHPEILPDLSRANLNNFNLSRANLSNANLIAVTLYAADLSYSNLIGAVLNNANLFSAELSGANLSAASLLVTNLSTAKLSEVDLSNAKLGYTNLGFVDLSTVKGLETIEHNYPSSIGIDTIYSSEGNIPEIFLKGAGLDDKFIKYVRSLIGKPIEYYSCFISYSSKDEAFAKRLYADLQNNNVRCWFATEDMDIGDKIRPRIEESIRLHDKLLLVLSENSIASNWVAYEVERALNKEPEGVPNVLYPIRLDNTVMTLQVGWAYDIKSTRHIGDFCNWKNYDDYQKAFSNLLRALKSEPPSRL